MSKQEKNDLSERNSRLLLVIGGVGLSGVLFKAILSMIGSSFSTITESPLVFNVPQIISSLVLSSFLLIFFTALFYCYFELHNYGFLSDGIDKKYAVKADKYYKYLLNSFKYSLFISLTALISFQMIPIFMNYFQYFCIFLTFISLLVISLLLKNKNYKKILISIKGINYRKINYNLIFVFGVIWASSMILTIEFGVKYNTNSQITFDFKASNKQLQINFNDTIPDYMPKEILVRTVNDKGKNREYILKTKEFYNTYVQVKSEEKEYGPINTILSGTSSNIINKSDINFFKTLKLDKLDSKKGVIFIQFKINKTSSTETYTVKNFYTIDKSGNVLFKQHHIKIDI